MIIDSDFECTTFEGFKAFWFSDLIMKSMLVIIKLGKVHFCVLQDLILRPVLRWMNCCLQVGV